MPGVLTGVCKAGCKGVETAPGVMSMGSLEKVAEGGDDRGEAVGILVWVVIISGLISRPIGGVPESSIFVGLFIFFMPISGRSISGDKFITNSTKEHTSDNSREWERSLSTPCFSKSEVFISPG